MKVLKPFLLAEQSSDPDTPTGSAVDFARTNKWRFFKNSDGLVVPMGSVFAQSAVASSHTGSTAEVALATFTIPANLLGANGRVRLMTIWSRNSGGAGNANYRIRYSGTSGTQYANVALTTGNLSAMHQVMIANRNATNSQVGATTGATGGWGPSGVAPVTSAVDTTAATTLVLQGQLANSGDTVTLESYLLEVFPKP